MLEMREALRGTRDELVAGGRLPRLRLRGDREADLADREELRGVLLRGRGFLRPDLIGLVLIAAVGRAGRHGYPDKRKARENGGSPGLLFLVAPRGVEPLILG